MSFSPGAFLVAFCIAYSLVFAMHWPLFQYFPLTGKFVWGRTPLPASGPAMAWYGLTASAALAAAVCAVVVPQGVVEGALRNRLWLFPVATIFVCVFLLRQFFG